MWISFILLWVETSEKKQSPNDDGDILWDYMIRFYHGFNSIKI